MLTLLRIISIILALSGLSALIVSLDSLSSKPGNKPKYFGSNTENILDVSGYALILSGGLLGSYAIRKINKNKNIS